MGRPGCRFAALEQADERTGGGAKSGRRQCAVPVLIYRIAHLESVASAATVALRRHPRLSRRVAGWVELDQSAACPGPGLQASAHSSAAPTSAPQARPLGAVRRSDHALRRCEVINERRVDHRASGAPTRRHRLRRSFSETTMENRDAIPVIRRTMAGAPCLAEPCAARCFAASEHCTGHRSTGSEVAPSRTIVVRCLPQGASAPERIPDGHRRLGFRPRCRRYRQSSAVRWWLTPAAPTAAG